MAYKQPRVPQMRDGVKMPDTMRELILFLKDFCMETWVQVTQSGKEIKALREEIEKLKNG